MKPLSYVLIAIGIALVAMIGVAVHLYVENSKKGERVRELEHENMLLQKTMSHLESRKQAVAALLPSPPEQRGEIKLQNVDATNSPEMVLRAYMTAKTWLERLALVSEPDKCREKMAVYYDRYQPPPAFRIVAGGPANLSPGQSHVYTVDIGNNPARYTLVQTDNGPRIDWLASRVLWDEDAATLAANRRAALLEKWRLTTHDLELSVLKKSQSSSFAKLTIQIHNPTGATFQFFGIKAKAMNKAGSFVSLGSSITENVKPDQSVTMEMLFQDTAVGDMASFEYTVTNAAVINEAGERFDALGVVTLIVK